MSTGFLAVAAREVHWLLRDRVARLIVIMLPLLAFGLLSATFRNAVVRDLGVDIVDQDRSRTSALFVQAVDAAPNVRVVARSGDLNAAMHAIRSGETIAAVYVPRDFERDLHHIPDGQGPRMIAFLGGTLGNFTPGARRRFLRDLGELLRPEDHLLIGHDLVKDVNVIEAAYNDSAGITAAFNRNILEVVNQELDADFDPSAFDHVAFFDIRHEWIEMRLRASREMTVSVKALDLEVHFDQGEELRTEISAKFTPERLDADFKAAGLVFDDLLTDGEGLYGLSLSHTA